MMDDRVFEELMEEAREELRRMQGEKEPGPDKKIIPFPRRHGRHRMIIKKKCEWQRLDNAWYWPHTEASGGAWIACCAAEKDGLPDWYYVPSKPGKWSYKEALAKFEKHCRYEERLEEAQSGNDPCEVCKRLEIDCKDCIESVFCQKEKIR